MVDFNKKIHNSDKFRPAAIEFLKTGQYCPYPKGTAEYMNYWQEQTDRSIYGYTADDGDYISGYNYFYLNFCPITRLSMKTIKRGKEEITRLMEDHSFPDFYDYDYYYFSAVDEAEVTGKHMAVLKSRRKGFSYKGAAMCCRNYYLLPESKSYVYASSKQYLTEDGILTKAWGYMDFIDEHTAWGKKRSVNTTMRKRAGMKVKDEYGNEIEVGYKSEIIGVTLKDNPDSVRGKRGKLILFEEAGTFPELKAAWQIARPSVEQGGITFGLMIAFGTGGDPGSSFEALKDMFYNPEGYNCLEFENIWDNTVSTKKCGFFCPQYTNLDDRDDKGNRIYMDNDGNTITQRALDYVLELRKQVIEHATSAAAIDRYVAERCITPAEACLEFNGNIFPKRELQEQLARIRTNTTLKNMKQVGDLVWDETGSVKWVMKKTGDIDHYPLRNNEDPTGAVVIWEHPPKEIPYGMYIIGVDPYDYDESGTTSLGSCFVYKRFQGFEKNYECIVAEYTGRPQTAQEFYETVRKLAVYYGAKIMYENQNKGLFSYFTAKHCDYLLADSPLIINDVVADSKVNRKKGCHMSKPIKLWGEGLIKDWLNEESADGTKNLFKIYSEPLLEELISYNDTDNYDRCLIKDTLITTSDGYKKVQDIRVGDKVLTHTGKLQTVTWIDKHKHDGFRVKLRLVGDYRTLECTDNHPILTAYTDKITHKFRKQAVLNVKWLRADELTYKYQFGLIPKRNLKDKIEISDDTLYVLGWIMSDGYVGKDLGVKITYQINQLDCAKRCLLIIEEYLKDEFFYYSRNNTRRITRKPGRIYRCNNCYRLEVHSKKLHDLAEWFGCKPNNKLINYEIYNKYGNLMPFIIGWLEGDGHQKLNANYDGYNRNCIEVATIYEELLLQCRLIMIDNGIYSSVRKVWPKSGKPQVSLCFSNEYVNKCLDFYPSLKFLKIDVMRDTSKVLETKEGFWSQIKLLEITPISEEVYNFEVQDDHSYIANGIVTHNCMAMVQVMIYREELYNVRVKEIKKTAKRRALFERPIFVDSWDMEDPVCTEDDDVYTFI